jgi:hypothetical protein
VKLSIGWSLAILFSFIILLIVSPIFSLIPWAKGISLGIHDFNEFKDYYSFVASLSGTFVGLCGLGAGYYYFFSLQVRTVQDQFVSKVAKIDTEIREILEKLVESETDLSKKRLQIQIGFEDLLGMIDGNVILRKSSERDAVIDCNSFVDKNVVISSLSFEELKEADVDKTYGNYILSIKPLKNLCVSKIL